MSGNTLEELQEKLRQMQQSPVTASVTLQQPKTLEQVPNESELIALVRRIICEELKKEIPKPIEPEPIPVELAFFNAIGLALTEEEQRWLSLPEVLKNVSSFLTTETGKAITRRFFDCFAQTFKQ